MPVAPKKVLVGDRDPIVLALLCHILNRQGFHAHPVVEPDELLRLMQGGEYDAVIVDALIDGAVDAILRAPDTAGRAIVTTLDGASVDGVYATLRKPLEFAQLVEVVHKCVHGE